MRDRILTATILLCVLIGFSERTYAQCPPGEELVGEDENNWYCEPKESIDTYNRLSGRYGFLDISWFRNRRAYDKLRAAEAKNLDYFVKFVLPRLNLTRDEAVLVLWWAYIEGILRKPHAPWGFVNCKDPPGEINDTTGVDCRSFRSGDWQVGYGVQVFDHLVPDRTGRIPLRTAFEQVYPNSLPKEIGDRVLVGASIRNLKFPALLDWQTLTQKARVENVQGSGRSNHFWASILMRDPRISARLEANVIGDPVKFPCYKPAHPTWCNHYYNRREEHSRALHTILNGLKDAGYIRAK